MTQGVLYIHSAPRALAPHIEWAASGVLGVPASCTWHEQPVGHGSSVRTRTRVRVS